MLPKKLRTPIQLFSKNAKSVFSDSYIVIKSHPNNLSHNRVGIILGRSILKSSAKRNKLRRKIFNFLRNEILLTKPAKGKDLLIILKAPIINLKIKELESKFKKYGEFV